MDLTEPPALLTQVRDIYVRTGFADCVGGEAAFDAGLADMKAGLLVVAAELVNAEQLGVELDDVVLDPQRFPHTSRLHGTLADVLVTDVSEEILRWVKRIIAMGPLPESAEITRAVAAMAAGAPNPFHRVLARLAMFESFCLTQRMLLRASGVQLEVLNGRRRDIEIIAAENVQASGVLITMADGLLGVEDPGAVLTSMIAASLARHVETLRQELTQLSGEVHRVLERRQRLMELLERVDPADAVIILNEAEDVSGEERLAPDQLRVLHPILLGDLSDGAIYQRVHRMEDRVRRAPRSKPKCFLDLILEAAEVRS